jgi:uncharacterized protein YerC
MSPAPLAHRLAVAEACYRAATLAAEKLRVARNLLVHEALAQGWTHQQISDATGLSRGRVSQIR